MVKTIPNTIQKVNKRSSLKTKITILTFVSIIITLLINLSILMPKVKTSLTSSTKHYLSDLSLSYCNLLDQSALTSKTGNLSTEQLSALLRDVGIKGISSSYAYLVSQDGTMLYHPTAEKIGQPVENSIIKEVVTQLQQGNILDNKLVTYNYNGKSKYASYTISHQNHWILVLTADEAEITYPIHHMSFTTLITGIVTALIFTLISYLVAISISRPITQLTQVVHKISNLDLTSDSLHEKLCKRSDEAGLISKTLLTMKGNIYDIIYKLDNVSECISSNAKVLHDVSTQVNDHSSNNSATSEELAAGMEETSATTESINQNILYIAQNTKHINQKTIDGSRLSTQIIDKANRLKQENQIASDNTMQMYRLMKDKTNLAIEQSKAVEKINMLTSTIMEIARQTSLLALNASIEAARAGESGRGFAVVADEIGHLANQSSDTTKNITQIVSEVYEAVNSMSDCLNKTLLFLEDTVLNDYKNFALVGDEYEMDANEFKTFMQEIHTDIETLQNTTEQITEAIHGINTTINESTVGVTDIAAKTSDIVSLTSKTYEMVSENTSYSHDLKEIVNHFKL